MSFLVKYVYILVFKVVLKRSTMAHFMSRLFVVWKVTPWRFKYCWAVALTNSVPSSDCMVIGYLFWNIYFKTVLIEVQVL